MAQKKKSVYGSSEMIPSKTSSTYDITIIDKATSSILKISNTSYEGFIKRFDKYNSKILKNNKEGNDVNPYRITKRTVPNGQDY